MKQHKNKILAAIVIFAVLAAAFFMGGNVPKQAEPAEPVVSDTVQEEVTVQTEAPTEPEVIEEEAEEESEEVTEAEEEPPAEPEIEPEQDVYHTDPVPEGKPEPVEPQEAEVTKQAYTCTISISCATILNNMDLCAEEKVELVPADGWILQPITVTFHEGESVFDVLLRTCRENKIHMEYMDTPMYNSAYIEGIANLYEFDVGPLSGWMYNVNGWFPNYGCSRYALQDGDTVEWVYTCDLGADVGDNSMGGQQP